MIGKRLGRWVLEMELGRGGMGIVYRARAADAASLDDMPSVAAVKVLSPQLALEPGFVDRFGREIAALERLRHPNIVRYLDSGLTEDCHYYAMEYVDGPSFEKRLRESGRLPWEQTLDAAMQICAALKHAHDHGVIHRDLKPPNLLWSKNGQVKLADFGIARVFSDARLTASHAVVGTADFLSPEQAAGKPVTKRSDLYSLGVLLYTLLTGRTPFQAGTVADMLHKHLYAQFDPPKRFVPELPPELDALVCQLMAKDPDQRPPDALVVGRILERLKKRTEQRSHATHDEVRTGSTEVGAGTQRADEPHSPTPAKVVGRIMTTEWEALNRAGPVGRLFNKSWVLLLILAAVVALAVWGFWPASVAKQIAAARELISQRDYDAAEALLKQQEKRTPRHDEQAEIDELLDRIQRARVIHQAKKLAGNWAGPFARPSCEAERLYREGILAHYAGRTADARASWQLVVDAYAGIPSLESWVVLAKEALSDTESPTDDRANLDEALRLAEKEPPAAARQRLTALEKSYAGRSDDLGRAAFKRIKAAAANIKGG